MAGHSFIGTWEIVGYGYRYSNGAFSEDYSLEGARFKLDESGDVTWTVTEKLKSAPLFSFETYEIEYTPNVGVSILFGEYDGHVLEFKSEPKDPKDDVILTCEGWCVLHCKRVHDDANEISYSVPFFLTTALEEGYFSDLVIKACTGKQFKVHTTILRLLTSEIDWNSEPPPFSNSPEDVLETILYYIYAECLPENLTETTAKKVIDTVSHYPCLKELENMCHIFIKNVEFKQQIINLVNDMHSCLNKIIEHFAKNNSEVENLGANPAKLCLVVKQSVRDGAVGLAKLLLLCDLFAKRKDELSREERHEVIRYVKSRFPVFFTQLQRLLVALKNTFGYMTLSQRTEAATFLVPEIEVILDTVSTLIIQVECALEQIIQLLAPTEPGKTKSGVGEMFGKSLRNVLHIIELTKLRNIHEHITCSLGLLIHKRQNFISMTNAQKVRSIARNLELVVEEFAVFLKRLEEDTTAFDRRLEWRDFKFCFKVGTSKVSGILQKLVTHRDTLQEVMLQMCELVQRDAFNHALQSLGLLDLSTVENIADQSKIIKSASMSFPKSNQNVNFTLVDSLCRSPLPHNSKMSKMSLELFNDSKNTDMEFEIINTNDEEDDFNSGSFEEEKCIIKAHRVIVASRCDWFRRALQSGMKEDIQKKIIIHDATPTIFRIFLEYLYSGGLSHSSLTTEQILELLLLSDRYEVDSLKQTCECCLQSNIDSDSALYLLGLADQYNAKTLKNSCLSFVTLHNDLTESEEFYELPLSLQAEVFDLVWTQPTIKKHIKDVSDTKVPKSASPEGDRRKVHHSSDESLDDIVRQESSTRMNRLIGQMRDIVGEEAPREQLVQVILAADFDLCRAINFYYTGNQNSQ